MYSYKYYYPYRTSSQGTFKRLFFKMYFKDKYLTNEHTLINFGKTFQYDKQMSYFYCLQIKGKVNYLVVKFIYDLYQDIHLTSIEANFDYNVRKIKFDIDHYTGKVNRIY